MTKTDTSIAPGVQMLLNFSMKRCVGARDAVASSTILTMRLMVLSLAAAVTWIRNSAAVLTEPATTGSPGLRATGMLSPVTGLSSTADWPSRINPSHGIRSPGRTCTMSPSASWSAGRSCTKPSRSTRAVRGMRFASALMPDRACPAATFSSISPTANSTTTKAASSAAPITTAPRAATTISVSMENGLPAQASASARRPNGNTAVRVAATYSQ